MMKKIDFAGQVPFFSGHEHIGSLSCVGAAGPLFNCDTVCGALPKNANINQLLFSPYLYGKLSQSGISPQSSYEEVSAALRNLDNTGLVRALELALAELYGCTLEQRSRAEAAVKINYARYYSWYEAVMKKMNCEKLVRTVHPQYLLRTEGDPAVEKNYNIPLIRVDTMLGYPENGVLNFDYYEDVCGIKIKDQESADAAIEAFFSLIDEHKVVGLKHFQAYNRTLTVTEPTKEQVENSFSQLSDPSAALPAQDFMLRRILEQADQRAMVFQIHTGMAHLDDSDPVRLEPLLSRYPHIRFVLLHCFPFVEKAAYLASVYPNVYVDTSWLVLQGEATLESALKTYLGIVPYGRILLSTDSTNLEEMYGAVKLTRRVLNTVLNEQLENGAINEEQCRRYAEALLYDNNKNLYSAR